MHPIQNRFKHSKQSSFVLQFGSLVHVNHHVHRPQVLRTAPVYTDASPAAMLMRQLGRGQQ